MQLLGAAAAELMPMERIAVFVVHLPADSALVSWPWMRSFSFGHPAETYCLRDDRGCIRVGGCARSGVLRRGGWRDGSCLAVAVRPCVWLVAGLCMLVVD